MWYATKQSLNFALKKGLMVKKYDIFAIVIIASQVWVSFS